jgi:general L-amino acid transport system substrate-binding protein
MSYEPVPIETNAEAQQQYLAGACDVYTTDASGLAATRATFEDPGRPRGSARDRLQGAARPARAPRRQRMGRHRPLDAERADHRRRAGHHLGQRRELAEGTNNPEINRLLGTEGNLGEMLGLDADWA